MISSQWGGSPMIWCLCSGRKRLVFSVSIAISFFCGGIEVDLVLEWDQNWLDFGDGVETNLVFTCGIEIDLVFASGSNFDCVSCGGQNRLRFSKFDLIPV